MISKPHSTSVHFDRRAQAFLVGAMLLLTGVFMAKDQHVFFWDTIQLGSKQAHFYFENSFARLILPEEIDSGHPPGFGILLATAWMIFGKSLLVSHWLMFPFVLGNLLLAYFIGVCLLGKKQAFFLPLLLLIDPVVAAQSVLISPDVLVVFGFLLAILGILQHWPGAKLIGALIMTAMSMRGMMGVVVLFGADILFNVYVKKKKLTPQIFFQKTIPFIPSGVLASAFLAYHYQKTGWIGYHEYSPWAKSFETVSLVGFSKNLLIYIWRMLDFGRVAICIMVLLLLGRMCWQRKYLLSDWLRWSGSFLLLSMLLLSVTFLKYKGLQAHRYLLPVYITLTIFFLILIKEKVSWRFRNVLFTLAFFSLLGGHFWVYPDKIAQGWDASLAHWPYYQAREEMLDYLEAADIDLAEVGTVFPEIGPLKYRDLSDRVEGMVRKDLSKQRYILYSNVMNDFTDKEIDTLKEKWKTLQAIERGGVRLILFENDDFGK